MNKEERELLKVCVKSAEDKKKQEFDKDNMSHEYDVAIAVFSELSTLWYMLTGVHWLDEEK